ncbi:MAG: NrtA/SsuA/CpmA family ABC transporter substrate-binding protein [Bacillota bacterium]
MFFRKNIAIAMLLLVVAFSAYLFLMRNDGVHEGQQVIRVGTWKTPQTIQPWFYQQFMPEGYTVEIFTFTNPGDQKTALLAGSLDFCGTTWVHAITSASAGEPVVCVASLCEKCSALVVRKDAGIANVEGLRNRNIGYVPGTMHEVLLRETLTRAGLDPQRDVNLMRVDFFDMGLALSRGDIDAFLSGEPYPTIAVAEGYGEILAYPYYDESIGTINAAWITTKEMIENRPEIIQALVTANAYATEYLLANNDKWLEQALEFGVDPGIFDESLHNIVLSWDMDDNVMRKVKTLAERMEALGLIREQPDWDGLFYTVFVEQARHELALSPSR